MRKFFFRIFDFCLAFVFMGMIALPAVAQEWTPYTGVGSSAHVLSPEVRNLPLAPGNVSQVTQVPLLRRPSFVPPGPPAAADPAVQTTSSTSVTSTAGAGFDGVGFNGYYPPDPNLSVSPTQIVQTTNVNFSVYDKSGTLQKGPVALDSLFVGMNNLCGSSNGGDPIVLWDKIANRWLISQLAYNSSLTTNYICIGVSQTTDATGKFNLYSFPFSHLPDYPKFGIWKSSDPNGTSDYYFSANLFSSVLYYGPVVCAFNGSDMQNGVTARFACSQGSTSNFSLLPSDYDGAASQAPSEPNNFVELSTAGTATTGQSLYMFPFTVTWGTSGTLNSPARTTIPVPAYTVACGGGTCVPQPGTSQQLDSLGDRLMYRLAYRKFSTYESLLVNHSVDPGTGTAAIRWYELRNTGSGWNAYQAATFAPDSTNYRWMASIAQDKNGNIGIAYSMANATSLNPSISYTGRTAGDPINTLSTSENNIITGAGTETGDSRWGDYTSLSLDPSDDCTFWYTNEYFNSSGAGNVTWSTRIDWFRLAGCGTIGSTPTSTTVVANPNPSVYGQSVTFTATVSPSAATGTVQFLDGTKLLGSTTLNGGSASLSTAALSAGSHSITAQYNGDSTYAVSTSPAFSQSVSQATTATSVSSSLNPSTFGQSVTFTATVSPSSATGTVQFLDGATSLGTATLNGSGIATLSTSTLSIGTHSITATYNGNTNFTGSTSSALSQSVNQGVTTTTVTSSLNPSTSGQNVTFTATISPSSATGTVQFFDGGTSLGIVTLNGGTASVSTSSLSVGTHSITAAYSGDSNFAGSTSATLTQTVTGGNFTLSASPSALSVPRGGTGTSTITVTASGGFASNVALSVSGVPPQSTATFKPSTVTGGSGTSVLTITVGRNTPKKSYTMTITGAGGGSTNSTNITLTVQ